MEKCSPHENIMCLRDSQVYVQSGKVGLGFIAYKVGGKRLCVNPRSEVEIMLGFIACKVGGKRSENYSIGERNGNYLVYRL